VILIASGSEVSLAVEAHEKLVAEGIRSRVVSMPSWDIFEHQTQEYQDSVLPPHVTARVAVEQASTAALAQQKPPQSNLRPGRLSWVLGRSLLWIRRAMTASAPLGGRLAPQLL
jgi:Transketolase, C-terminal domain